MRILIAIFLFGMSARATPVLSSSVSSFYLNNSRGQISDAVAGSACVTMTPSTSQVSCNPALAPLVEGSIFGVNLFFGNDYDTLYKNRDLMSEENKLKLAQNLLSEKRPVRFEGSAQLWWRSERVSFLYEPLRWTYFSRARNQAYPDIAVHAMQEQAVIGQYAMSSSKSLRWGLQVRGVERKFIQDEFNLFDGLSHMEDYFQVKKQQLLFIEPSVDVSLAADDPGVRQWNPRWSLMIQQLGVVDHKYAEAPVTPFVDTGLSVDIPVGFGEWQWGLSYRFIENPDEERKFRLVTRYSLGLATFSAGYDPDEWSFGVLSTFRILGAGLMYKRASAMDYNGQRVYDDSTFFEFRILM